MTDSQTLLADFAELGSEAAFKEIVARYLDLVYSTAFRLTGGNSHSAEDVVQTVFIDLARHAKGLSAETKLGGWLHRHTCFVAAKMLRGERRRQLREKAAFDMSAQPDHSKLRMRELAPVLDEAINQLSAVERAAVLLRFYERLDFNAIGHNLGINESAAQKRVARALEKLQVLLKRQGVALSVAALGAVLAGEAVTAAPAGMAAGIAATAIANAAVAPANLFSLFKLMASTKTKTAAIAAILAASILTPFIVERQAQAKLEAQDAMWRSQSNQLAALTADNQRLTTLIASEQTSHAPTNTQRRELMKLRGQAGLLRSRLQRLVAANQFQPPQSPEDHIAALKNIYASRVAELKDWLDANPSQKIPELKRVTQDDWLGAVNNRKFEDDTDFARAASLLRANLQGRVMSDLWTALRKYGADNGGQFPTSLGQLQSYLAAPLDPDILQGYEIVPSSSLIPELRPGGDWAITETSAADPVLDSRSAIGLGQHAARG